VLQANAESFSATQRFELRAPFNQDTTCRFDDSLDRQVLRISGVHDPRQSKLPCSCKRTIRQGDESPLLERCYINGELEDVGALQLQVGVPCVGHSTASMVRLARKHSCL
jgi:hypothetical protein